MTLVMICVGGDSLVVSGIRGELCWGLEFVEGEELNGVRYKVLITVFCLVFLLVVSYSLLRAPHDDHLLTYFVLLQCAEA